MSSIGTGNDNNGQIGMAVDGTLGITLSRRRVLGLLGGAGAAAVVAGIAGATPAAAAQRLVTTAAVNLRAKPVVTARVIRVLGEGTIVTRIGGGSGRYIKVVTTDAVRGYVHLDYLNDADHHAPDPDFVRDMQTTTDVNFRSGPSTSNFVFRVLAPGTIVTASNQVESGFRYVLQDGLAGWVWDGYLTDEVNGGDGGSGVLLRTTTAVNLRATASTSAAVLTVIPAGAQVFGLGERSNGFEKVRYDNKTGWVYASYLS